MNMHWIFQGGEKIQVWNVKNTSLAQSMMEKKKSMTETGLKQQYWEETGKEGYHTYLERKVVLQRHTGPNVREGGELSVCWIFGYMDGTQ